MEETKRKRSSADDEDHVEKKAKQSISSEGENDVISSDTTDYDMTDYDMTDYDMTDYDDNDFNIIMANLEQNRQLVPCSRESVQGESSNDEAAGPNCRWLRLPRSSSPESLPGEMIYDTAAAYTFSDDRAVMIADCFDNPYCTCFKMIFDDDPFSDDEAGRPSCRWTRLPGPTSLELSAGNIIINDTAEEQSSASCDVVPIDERSQVIDLTSDEPDVDELIDLTSEDIEELIDLTSEDIDELIDLTSD